MNKIYKAFLTIFGGGIIMSSVSVYAQTSGIFIHRESDPGVAYNGETVQVSGEEYFLYETFYVQNISGSPQEYRWERVRLSINPASITDQMCDDWFCVDCDGEVWQSGHTIPVADTDSSLFKPQVIFQSGGNASYKYYIQNSAGTRLDSITVNFGSTLNINETLTSKEVINIYPNPASDYITIEHARTGDSFELYDMLGKRVMKSKIASVNQKLSITELPDGIYFYSIRDEYGVNSASKKLIIRK